MKYSNELRDRVERNLRMFDYPRFDDGDIEALIGEIDRPTAELAEARTVLKSKEIIIDNQEKRINELAERLLKK